MTDRDPLEPFRAPYAEADDIIAARLLAEAARPADAEQRIDQRARALIEGIRSRAGGLGGIEDFLHAYSLSTKEGLALMVLAEALLRVPDDATTDRLIEDKLATGEWDTAALKSDAFLVSASAWTLGITARIILPGETPETIIDSLLKRLGLPAVRTATRQAMRLLGSHFVLGQTIDEALRRASHHPEARYSFDMLGEGARTAADARRYRDAYAAAIAAIGASAGEGALPDRPGISIKLSALHPRFEAVSRERVLKELVPDVIALARQARDHDLNFTIDAEEADRLELTLDVLARVLADPSLRGWEGFGLAVQAYQKRAEAVIAWLDQAARSLHRRLMVRLVKGAYWDTEIKRAQERGLAGYPVFTRKAMTDLCYDVCARQLLAARARLFPQFATHNALTVASVIEDAGGVDGYEFQRLHGMGEVLYEHLRDEFPHAAVRVYAPVGSHRDLLAYLVRRLLENGANSSFVAVAADPSVPVEILLKRPHHWVGDASRARHRRVPLPRDLYEPQRRNSSGVEFGDQASLDALLAEVRAANAPVAAPKEADEPAAHAAMAQASAAFPAWQARPVAERAAILERAADLMEARRGALIALMQSEGGKTLDDCVSEVRETVDFCRYYAVEARRALGAQPLPGPTGESNALTYRGRGVFVCISPWNFPLSIFTGQVVAALVAGKVPDAALGKQAKQRSLHNNYLTLPVVLMMISNHYPMMFEHAQSWLIVAGILLFSGLLRLYANMKNAGAAGSAVTAILFYAAMVGMGAIAYASYRPGADLESIGPVTFADVQAIMAHRCQACHSATPTDAAYKAPPKGIAFDTADQIQRMAPQIERMVVLTRAMPIGNKTGMLPEERLVIAKWLADTKTGLD